MSDKLDWRVAIIGYDRSRWNQYLSAYARQPDEAQRLMDDGRRKTHFVQDIDDEIRSIKPYSRSSGSRPRSAAPSCRSWVFRCKN
jgi:hypothetical protein